VGGFISQITWDSTGERFAVLFRNSPIYVNQEDENENRNGNYEPGFETESESGNEDRSSDRSVNGNGDNLIAIFSVFYSPVLELVPM